MSDVHEEKRRIREMVWRLLESRRVARFPLPVRGRIPNFVGAEEAARRLAELEVWKRARIVKINPDSPQRPVRLIALKQGKILVFATPRMRSGFLVLDPRRIPPHLVEAASTIRGAFRWGRAVGLDELGSMSVDLMVTGSVAVDRRGTRLGKGEGFAELEYGVLRSVGAMSEETPIITTIHDLQIVDYIPREPHDLVVDVAVTPSKVLTFEKQPRPPGIIWSELPCRKLEEIPLLRELAARMGVEKPCREATR